MENMVYNHSASWLLAFNGSMAKPSFTLGSQSVFSLMWKFIFQITSFQLHSIVMSLFEGRVVSRAYLFLFYIFLLFFKYPKELKLQQNSGQQPGVLRLSFFELVHTVECFDVDFSYFFHQRIYRVCTCTLIIEC